MSEPLGIGTSKGPSQLKDLHDAFQNSLKKIGPTSMEGVFKPLEGNDIARAIESIANNGEQKSVVVDVEK